MARDRPSVGRAPCGGVAQGLVGHAGRCHAAPLRLAAQRLRTAARCCCRCSCAIHDNKQRHPRTSRFDTRCVCTLPLPPQARRPSTSSRPRGSRRGSISTRTPTRSRTSHVCLTPPPNPPSAPPPPTPPTVGRRARPQCVRRCGRATCCTCRRSGPTTRRASGSASQPTCGWVAPPCCVTAPSSRRGIHAGCMPHVLHMHVHVLEAATRLARTERICTERLRTNVSRRLCPLRRSGRAAAAPPPPCSSSDCCSKPFTNFEAAVTEKEREAAERRKEVAEAQAQAQAQVRVYPSWSRAISIAAGGTPRRYCGATAAPPPQRPQQPSASRLGSARHCATSSRATPSCVLPPLPPSSLRCVHAAPWQCFTLRPNPRLDGARNLASPKSQAIALRASARCAPR